MDTEVQQGPVKDWTPQLRLANLAIILVVWLGWTAISLLKPIVDLVPSWAGPYFLGGGITIALIATILIYGYGGGYFGSILAVTIAAVALLIGVVVVGQFQTSLPTKGLTAEQGQAISSVFSTSYSSFNLFSLFLILVGVWVVIYILMNFIGTSYHDAFDTPHA